MNKTEGNKVTKEKKEGNSSCRIVKCIWNAGYHFIPILFATTIILSFMYCSDNGYHLVKKGHSVAIDSVMIISPDRDTTIVALTNSVRQDSLIARVLTKQEPKDEVKGSYLSLWAAALAVIFVVFSIFGVLKLELTKNEIEDKLKDVDKLRKETDWLMNQANQVQKYGLITQQISNIIKGSSHDYKSARERKIKIISGLLNELEELNLNIDYYGILLEVYSMEGINDNIEEENRMNLVIKFLNKGIWTTEKLLLLGESYYRLYTSVDSNNNFKQDCLRNSISVYCAILKTDGREIIDDDLYKKMELPKKNISNDIQISSERYNESNDILFALSRALYDYALNYCDENLRQVVLQKASNILDAITK